MTTEKIGLFDIVNNINTGTVPFDLDEIDSVYNMFMINRAFSNTRDTVLLANELNQKPWMSKSMHYGFWFNVVNKKKRFGKWNKANIKNKDDIELIMKYYNYSYTKAREVLGIVDMNHIKSMMNEGGKIGKKTT